MSLRENATCAQRAATLAGFSLAVLLAGCSSPQVETNESSSPPFIEAGDFEDIRRRGTLRILVPNLERSSYLPRTGSPLDAERALIESFAFMEEVEPYWISVDSRSALIPSLLREGRPDRRQPHRHRAPAQEGRFHRSDQAGTRADHYSQE